MPYFRATYDSARDKIWATMGPYIAKCNASTGERESLTRIVDSDESVGPCYGDMSICYHTATDSLFVGTGTNIHKQRSDVQANEPPATRDIYKINPDTMVKTALQTYQWFNGFDVPFATESKREGTYHIVEDGDYIHAYSRFVGGNGDWVRIHATSFAWNYYILPIYWGSEQIAFDSDYVYSTEARYRGFYVLDKTQSGVAAYENNPHTIPYYPIAMGVAAGKPWFTDGSHILCRHNDWDVDNDYTEFDLSLIAGPSVFPDPCRMQLLSDGLLYLPCMSADGIVVFNPSTGAGTWRGGFTNPIDVVETASKKWAVQASPVGLKEIT